MSDNIFTQTKEFVNPPKRNTFDLSFQNNLTMEFGKLYPVFLKEVLPGDSFRIQPTFALRMLPMVFPVQTRIKANLHFFYVRNRNLWKDWSKFIGHTDNTVVSPYLGSFTARTRSLADYLGIPTTGFTSAHGNCIFSQGVKDTSRHNRHFYQYHYSGTRVENYQDWHYDGAPLDFTSFFDDFHVSKPVELYISFRDPSRDTAMIADGPAFVTAYVITSNISDLSRVTPHFYKTTEHLLEEGDPTEEVPMSESEAISFLDNFFHTDLHSPDYSKLGIRIDIKPDESSLVDLNGISCIIPNASFPVTLSRSLNDEAKFDVSKLRISALPFRAYESVYNAFYRNEQNDPLLINGRPVYDQYLPNLSGGLDAKDYELHYRNWEPDFLTSSVQSPQQGIAPLVGVSSLGDFTFVNKDANGNVNYFAAKAQLASDGNTITGFKLSDHVQLKGVDQSSTDLSNVPDDVKRGTLYSLNQMALAGISINDFRNVNSLQRWLETNIRRGYKYRDQILSHYGVEVRYDELDMPEFIGGMSEPIYINQVNQTVGTEGDQYGQPLGSYAGQGSVVGTSEHAIEQYCDEHGFIIGILSVTPTPNYTQLLPKFFTKENYLDYYFPEFGHIGMQPITYKEVCPTLTKEFDPTSNVSLNDTFGYQRAWNDYIASVDEVHGLYRTSLRNFVLNRVFSSPPKLNSSFLNVNPLHLNDIFTVQDVSDKILGQVYFDVSAKRPIPRMGIPRLE